MASLKSLRTIVDAIIPRLERRIDPFSRFTPRDWADLPPHHPRDHEETPVPPSGRPLRQPY